MRTRLLFIILTLLLIALTAKIFIYSASSEWWTIGLLCAIAVALTLTYISSVRPITALSTGAELLRGQDFSSRLAHTGHHDTDKLVDLFNNMINQLRRERLRQQEQNSFLALLIDASPMGIIIYDFNGNTTQMNPAAKQMVQDELANAIANIPPDSSDTVRLADNNIYKVSNMHFVELGFRRRFTLIEPLTDEVYRAEREAYGKVIRTIAHEVNNTMAGVKSLMDTLSATIANNDMQFLLDSCGERCSSMSKFITAYANVVKIPEPTPLLQDINTFISRQMPFLEAMASPDIAIILNLSTQPATASFDAPLMEQVIVNITKNAVESIRSRGTDSPKGQIVINTTVQPSTIEITDNGIGIATELSRKLFTPFLTTKPEGQGLGLTIISEILKKHNCKYSLSTIAHQQTKFRIEFQ